MKNLVIVESPSKAHTINKYLGKDFLVKPTVGHIKDLPKKTIGVDVKKGFEPEYEIISGKEKTVDEIKKLAKDAGRVFLAADPDREGEAIAWNIKEVIDTLRGPKPEISRVLFNEITKDAVINAIKNPSVLNKPMYESQKARRILDRLVGYNLSPFLWEKIRRGLSAGRVQSVALYLIVEREKEINSFVKEEYWTFTALFEIKIPKAESLRENEGIVKVECELFKINGKNPEIKDENGAEELKDVLLKIDNYKIKEINKKQTAKKPPLPLITSTLQQEAARFFRFPVKKTMTIAQKLYEGIELGPVEGVSKAPLGPLGLITYMRTDSTRISDEASGKARGYISAVFGDNYIRTEPSIKKGGAKKVQDAHEAVRPTDINLSPGRIKEYLSPDEFKLYSLIWAYFTAFFMKESIYDQYSIMINGNVEGISGRTDIEYSFKTTENVLHFDGFQRVINEHLKSRSEGDAEDIHEEKHKNPVEKVFPFLSKGNPAEINKVESIQHFTSPPPRYTEATLVKALDENGIGRPSTYQAIISNIKNKDYVIMTTESSDTTKKGSSVQKFKPTELGMTVSDILKEGFSDILDLKFTANMEKKLDEIEKGGTTRNEVLSDFYEKFLKDLSDAKFKIKNIKGTSTPTDIICEKCGKPMVIKMGRFGKFLACSGYPACKNTRELQKEGAQQEETGSPASARGESEATGEICEKCGKPMVIKMGRFGKFLACSGYPACKNIKPVPVKFDNKAKVHCPTGCGGYLVEKRTRKGRRFFSCSNYPTCKYAAWSLPNP